MFFGGLTSGLEKDGIEDQINQQLGGDALAQLTAYTSEAVKAINEGYDLSDLDVGNLEAILEFVRMAEELGIGQNVRGSLAQSLTDAGVPTTTENLLENLQLLIDDAKGVGEDAGAGIGEGMASADLTPYAQTVAANADTALRSSGAFDSASPANSTKPVGADAALGSFSNKVGITCSCTGIAVSNPKSFTPFNNSGQRPICSNVIIILLKLFAKVIIFYVKKLFLCFIFITLQFKMIKLYDKSKC